MNRLRVTGRTSTARAPAPAMRHAVLSSFGLVLGCSSSAVPTTAPNTAPADAATDTSIQEAPPGPDAGAVPDASSPLFEGALTAEWKMSTIVNQPGRDDPGHFIVEDGALVSVPGTDLGLLWHTRPTPPNFVLELEWKLSAPDDNSGVFVRFPALDSKGYDNTAWVAVNFGFEVQINEPGSPDGAPEHTTGAIYGETNQTFSRVVANGPGTWNTYVIRVEANVVAVTLNGQQVTRFVSPYPERGVATAAGVGVPTFVGLQTHSGRVAFRNIRIRDLGV